MTTDPTPVPDTNFDIRFAGPPDDYTLLLDSDGLTHMDISNQARGAIPLGLSDALKAGKFFTAHYAWHFNGVVWYEPKMGGVFCEQVWQYQHPVGKIITQSLESLIKAVNDYYSWE